MQRKNLTGLFLFLFLSVIFTSFLNTSFAKPKSITEIQKSLNKYSQKLDAIETKLSKKTYNADMLTSWRDEVKKVSESLTPIMEEYKGKVSSWEEKLTELGEAPKKDASPENKVTAKLRKDYEENVELTSNVFLRAKNINQRALQTLITIANANTQLVAKSLIKQDAKPLISSSWGGIIPGTTKMISDASKVLTDNINVAKKRLSIDYGWVIIPFLILFLIAIIGVGGRWLINQAHPEQIQRTNVALIRLSGFTVSLIKYFLIPTLVAWSPFLVLFYMQAINTIGWKVAYTILYLLSTYWLITALIQASICPTLEEWKMTKHSENSARKLFRCSKLIIMLILVSYAFDLFAKTALWATSPILMTAIEAVLRIVTCFSLFVILKSTNWITFLSGLTQNQRKFAAIFRFFALPIVTITPIVMILGYSFLADFVFFNFIESIAIILAVSLVAHLTNQSITALVGETGILSPLLTAWFSFKSETFNLLEYWINFLAGIFFWLAAISLVLIEWGISIDHFTTIADQLITGFSIGKSHISIISLLLGILVFTAFLLLTKFIQRVMDIKVFPYTRWDKGAQHALNRFIFYIGFIIALIIGITTIGIELSSLAIIFGAFAIGASMGLQGIVSNFAAGIIMLIERPIKVGDFIVVGENRGTVQNISVRATEIKLKNNSTMIIPNNSFITSDVNNWDYKRNKIQREHIAFGVSYDTDLDKLNEVVMETVEKFDFIAKNPEPVLLFENYGDSSLEFRLRVYLTITSRRAVPLSNIRFELMRQFRKYSIDLPFPQRDIHIMQNPQPSSPESK